MKNLTISEITFITIIAATMGVIWWLYTFIYNFLAPLLQMFAMDNLLSGVWLMGGVFFAYIIRKPGSALLGEVTAAIVQGFISQWGVSSLIYGITQGLGAELIFFMLSYKYWNWGTIILAATASAICGFITNFFWLQYYKLSFAFNITQFCSAIISGIVFAGILTKIFADKLACAGVLNQFNIAKSVAAKFKPNLKI